MVAGATEDFSEQFQDSFVSGGIDGRGGDFDLQLVPDRTGDFVAGGARLDFQRNANAVGSLLEIGQHQAEDNALPLKRHGCEDGYPGQYSIERAKRRLDVAAGEDARLP